MDLLQMETFLAVAEEKSFSRAASARLHRTQPAISQAIAKLEADLGEVLIERSTRDASLTAAGEVLREYAVKLLNLRMEATTALSELRELHQGRLNIAANEYTCLYLLPLLNEYRRQNPRIKIAVQRALASKISDEVLLHTVELGVISFRPEDTQLGVDGGVPGRAGVCGESGAPICAVRARCRSGSCARRTSSRITFPRRSGRR